MDAYISYPIQTDPQVLAQEAFDYLAEQMPGWVPAPGNLESWVIEAAARMVAEAQAVASDVPRSILRYVGANLYGLPPVDAAAASATSTWTMTDDAGYTIPEGTLVGLRAAGDVLVGFATSADVVIPPGSTATAAGEVALVAVDPGAQGSGLSGTPELIDALAFVAAIALVGTTTGGADAESDDDYLDRLSRELELMTPTPILPDEFAVLARRIAGVERAAAIDGYDPGDESTDNERMITVFPIDATGEPVSGGTKTAIAALLESMREVNFVVHVADPDYVEIDVAYTAVCFSAFDPADVEARIDAALEAFLSPGNWGRPDFGDVSGPTWINEPVVRFLEVASLIDRVEGVRYVATLTVDGGTADVTLSSTAVGLPRPGTIGGSVSAG